jgi:hypothetical protein
MIPFHYTNREIIHPEENLGPNTIFLFHWWRCFSFCYFNQGLAKLPTLLVVVIAVCGSEVCGICWGMTPDSLLCIISRWLHQSCKWNERSLNRGLNRGRGLGSNETFFWDSCSNHEIDENFRISHKLVTVSPRRFLKRSRSSSFAMEANKIK